MFELVVVWLAFYAISVMIGIAYLVKGFKDHKAGYLNKKELRNLVRGVGLLFLVVFAAVKMTVYPDIEALMYESKIREDIDAYTVEKEATLEGVKMEVVGEDEDRYEVTHYTYDENGVGKEHYFRTEKENVIVQDREGYKETYREYTDEVKEKFREIGVEQLGNKKFDYQLFIPKDR